MFYINVYSLHIKYIFRRAGCRNGTQTSTHTNETCTNIYFAVFSFYFILFFFYCWFEFVYMQNIKTEWTNEQMIKNKLKCERLSLVTVDVINTPCSMHTHTHSLIHTICGVCTSTLYIQAMSMLFTNASKNLLCTKQRIKSVSERLYIMGILMLLFVSISIFRLFAHAFAHVFYRLRSNSCCRSLFRARHVSFHILVIHSVPVPPCLTLSRSISVSLSSPLPSSMTVDILHKYCAPSSSMYPNGV